MKLTNSALDALGHGALAPKAVPVYGELAPGNARVVREIAVVDPIDHGNDALYLHQVARSSVLSSSAATFLGRNSRTKVVHFISAVRRLRPFSVRSGITMAVAPTS